MRRLWDCLSSRFAPTPGHRHTRRRQAPIATPLVVSTLTIGVLSAVLCREVSAQAFGPPMKYDAGTAAWAIAAGDVNGDAIPDVVVTRRCGAPDSVSVLLGTGNGEFGPRANYVALPEPYAVAIGDLDKDGLQDLAVAISGHSVSVYWGSGGGQFNSRTDILVGGALSAPISLAIGDVDEDEWPDIVAASFPEHGVWLLSGPGSPGAHGPGAGLPTDLLPYGVAIGDVSGDGTPDLVTANYSGSVSVLIGTGNGYFDPAMNYPAEAGSYAVAIGDLNHDFRLDLVVTWTTGGPQLGGGISVFLGTGGGAFGPRTDILGGIWSPTAIGDMDGDADPDLTQSATHSGVSVHTGNGAGGFDSPIYFPAGSYCGQVAIADLNGDGRLDVAVITGNDSTLSVLLARDPIITATAGVNGAIIPGGTITVPNGTDQSFNVTPNDPCRGVSYVLVDGTPVGAVTSYAFTDVRRDHTIEAGFMPLGPFLITATAETGGSISPGGAYVYCGQSQQFDITPADGHVIFDVLVDEVSVGTPASYTFQNVYADHTLRARFAVDVTDAPDGVLPAALWLGQVTPSPVRSAAEIHLGLPRATDVSLTVHDVSGRTIATLANGPMTAGEHVVRWDTREASGAPAPSGVYFYRLAAAGKAFERKVIERKVIVMR